MSPTVSPQKTAFLALFNLYTSRTDGIGAHLAQQVLNHNTASPLVVISGTDVQIFTSGGPIVNPLRQALPGFLELAAISHIGPSLGALVTVAQGGGTTWQDDAKRLVYAIESVRTANTVEFWLSLDVAAWGPNIGALRNMVEYACALSLDYLARFQVEPDMRTFEALVTNVLESRTDTFPIPFDYVMVATFCLTGLNGTCASLAFLRTQSIDWASAMVILTSGNGGPTAALTRCTNHFVDLLGFATNYAVRPERTFFAPIQIRPDDPNPEVTYRAIWAHTYARTQLAGRMFPDYPSFVPPDCPESNVTPSTRKISAPPRATSADDLFSFVARLRFVMEDATQLLSTSVSSYILGQLIAGTAPENVPIPGLTGVTYPAPPGVGEDQTQVPGLVTSAGPALVAMGSSLYLACKGADTDTAMYMAAFNGSEWALLPRTFLSGIGTDSSPAMAAFGGNLYLAWKGNTPADTRVFWARFDGNSWFGQMQIPGIASSTGPALAIFENRLYLACKGAGADTEVYMTVFDGAAWSPLPREFLNGIGTDSNPALAATGGNLYLAWKGNKTTDTRLFYASFNSDGWSEQAQILGLASSTGPALAVFESCDSSLGNLYLSCKGAGADTSIQTALFNGTSWFAQTPITNVGTDSSPALTAFGSRIFMAWKGNKAADTRVFFTHELPEDVIL